MPRPEIKPTFTVEGTTMPTMEQAQALVQQKHHESLLCRISCFFGHKSDTVAKKALVWALANLDELSEFKAGDRQASPTPEIPEWLLNNDVCPSSRDEVIAAAKKWDLMKIGSLSIATHVTDIVESEFNDGYMNGLIHYRDKPSSREDIIWESSCWRIATP